MREIRLAKGSPAASRNTPCSPFFKDLKDSHATLARVIGLRRRAGCGMGVRTRLSADWTKLDQASERLPVQEGVG